MAIQNLIKGEPDWHIKVNSNNTEYSNQIGDLTTDLSDNAYLSKYKNIYNPIYLEQFFRTWYGRGQLTAEIPYETIAGTTTFAQNYSASTTIVNVLDATYFLEGSVLAVEYDDGTHDTYFVFSKSGNTITLYPGLRKAVTTTTKIQRAWYNSAHANDFALKYIGEQLANAKYQNVISGEVIKEFNMNETNILQQFKKIGGATITTQSEINKGANYGTPLTSVSNQAISVIGYASGDGYRTIDIPVKPSSKVNINVWLRANKASNSVNIKTSTGILLGSINVCANNMYELYDLSCNIPFNVNKIYIEFVVTAAATVGIYIDDLVVSYREKEGYILPRKGNIVMLFDSWGNWFTTGIENSLKSLLPQANIINKSVGGNTATDMLNRL